MALKLGAYIINGQTVGIDIFTWNISDLNGNASFQAKATLDEGYADITSLVNWDRFGQEILDYWQVRNQITTIVYIQSSAYTNWAGGLNDAEKLVACKWIAAPYAIRIATVVDDEIDKANWKTLIVESFGRQVEVYKGRSLVAEKLRQCIGEELRVETISKADLDLFYADSTALVDEYTWTNSPNLKNWLQNTVGSPYETNGFAQKGYYTDGRRDKMVDILVNLNY